MLISVVYVLSDSFLPGLLSSSIKAHHVTNTGKAKLPTSPKKKVQPKSQKLPITTIAKGKKQTVYSPKQSQKQQQNEEVEFEWEIMTHFGRRRACDQIFYSWTQCHQFGG